MELLTSFGVKEKTTTIKNPQANAIVKRFHQVIADYFRAMNLSSRRYDEDSSHAILQAVAWGIRSTYHTALKATPGQLTFGRDMVIGSTYLANWKMINEERKKNVLYNNARENRKRISFDYQPNQMVYLLSKDIKRKLDPNEGPYLITKVHTNGTVEIRRSPTVTERVNIRRIHPAF